MVLEGPPGERVLAIKELSRGPLSGGAVERAGPPEVIQGPVETCQGARPTGPTLKRTLNNLSLSGGEGKFQFIFEEFEGERLRIAESFLIPVCAEVRIEHANPTALFTRVADACKGLDNSILAEAANQVAHTRKKVMSPRCLLDCVEAAKKLARVV